MEKVLVVGDGAREHALAWSLSKSGVRVYAMGKHVNPGIKDVVKRTGGDYRLGDYLDPAQAVKTAEEISPDLVVIGPEEPLFRGVSDRLIERGFLTLGAPFKGALIEMRKDIARNIMWKYKIPGRLAFAVFKDLNEALSYIKAMGSVAIKPIRQAGGKGVRVVYSSGQYLEEAREQLARSRLADVVDALADYRDVESGVLVEEAVWGVEYTVQALADGSSVLPFPAVQDNPHAFELGLGPECGGMGTVAPLDYVTEEEQAEAAEILKRTIEAVKLEFGVEYRGVISAQMMLTAYGPTLIEFYSRFGDPEALNVMYLLDGDAYELFTRAASGRLGGLKVGFRGEYTVVKAIAPLGYPVDRAMARGRRFTIDWDIVQREGCYVFFGSAVEDSAGYVTLGSRAVEILAAGRTPSEAYERAERCATAVRGDGLFYRRDIGSAEYLRSMRDRAEKVRAVYKWRRERGLGGKRIDWAPGAKISVVDYA